jgi:hypothetical protein
MFENTKYIGFCLLISTFGCIAGCAADPVPPTPETEQAESDLRAVCRVAGASCARGKIVGTCISEKGGLACSPVLSCENTLCSPGTICVPASNPFGVDCVPDPNAPSDR